MKNIYKQIATFGIAVLLFLTVLVANSNAQMPDVKKSQKSFLSLKQFKSLNQKSLAAKAGGTITPANVESFDLGFSFVRVMYFASIAQEDPEANTYAIVELVYLIDRFDGKPEAVALQNVLKALVRGNGSGGVFWNRIEAIAKGYSAKLKGEQKWYFDSGNTLTRLSLATYLGDAAMLKKELQNLQALTKIAPKTIPTEILQPMASLAKYAAQGEIGEAEFLAIDETIGGVMDNVFG